MTLKLRENLLRLMKEKGQSQTQLSKLSGIPKTTLSNYINSTQKNQSKYDIAQIKKLAEVLKTDFYDYFIFGHRHYPIDYKLNDKSRYINLGDWINNCTYVVFNGMDMELKKWEN